MLSLVLFFALGCTDKGDGTDTADVDTITGDSGSDDGTLTDDGTATDDTGPTGTDDTGPTGTDDTGPTGTDDTGDTDDTGTSGPVDEDGDGYPSDEDCDDTDATVNPDADEVPYDGVDNDCDPATVDDDLDGDGFTNTEDCDDEDADINPFTQEVCDGVDNNCDGNIDEDSAADAPTWYVDADEDGFGLTDDSVVACDQPEGYAPYYDDCDDTDPAYNPGATEDDCTDPNDYNCDGAVGYEDGDGDGFAACEECDDADASINPDADEICDELDNNCDGVIDEDTAVDAETWYRDLDEDSWGDPAEFIAACDEPLGYTDNDLDCDDSDAALNLDDRDGDGVTTCDNDCDDSLLSGGSVYPGADEVCNDTDDDCDAVIDEDATDADTWYADDDEDGWGDIDSTLDACDQPLGYIADSTDCDDTDASLNNDDVDADGFSTCDGDCDDSLLGGAINPGADELCDDVDNDCDLTIDEDAIDATTWYADADEDSYGDAGSTLDACEQPDGYITDNTDCDDSAGTTYPGADETCNDTDDDCDAAIDEDATDFGTYYSDADEDGEGDIGASVEACSQPDGYVTNATDCDDTDASLNTADSDADAYTTCGGDCDDDAAAINPGAEEICDALDNDCDGTVDVGASDESTFYTDLDGDGWGDPDSPLDACDQPTGTVENADDCDDSDGGINPDALETCNDIDDDCDTTIDEDPTDPSTYYTDSDGDGYGDASSAEEACDQPAGTSTDSTDCDDGDVGVNPGATETCSGLDEDCDTLIDEGFDTDLDDIADCFEVDYEIDLLLTADDNWEGWVDGGSFDARSGWSTSDGYTFTLDSGPHTIAIYAYDSGLAIAGFLAQVEIDGVDYSLTGDGGWVSVDTDPGAGWEAVSYDDSAWVAPLLCADTSPWGGSPADLRGAGADWVWVRDCLDLGAGWFRLNLDLP